MKKFIKYLFALTAQLLIQEESNVVYAQNLVKNPSFENYVQCPVGAGLFNGYVIDWFGFNPGSPSFFHSCATVPINSYGFQYANTGGGYACILAYNWNYDPDKRNYIEGDFIYALKKDSIYCINYFVNLCNNSYGGIKNVDAAISDTLINWNNGAGNFLINIYPQIKSSTIITDSVNWTLISGLYKAKGNENHITIGNFELYANTSYQSFYPVGTPISISYYIDDVSVTPTNLTAPNLGNDTIICKNTLPYSLYAPVGYDSYQWSNGGTSSIIAVNDSGMYWVKCILTGCGEISDTVHISFKNIHKLNLGNDTIVCVGSSVNLTAQPNFISYLWNTSDTSQNILVNDSGLYIVQATDVCGMQTDSVHVTLDSLPSITIDIGIDTTICNRGTNVPFLLSSNVTLPNYNWSNGAITSQISVTKKGWYWLQSKYNCGTIESDSIFIDECPPDTLFGLYLPNSFTPNDDGLNDFFTPQFYNVTITNFKIFNRWGNVVYEDSNNFSWDGKFESKDCTLGVYVYKISYRDLKNNYIEKLGRITLLR
ncbi:MAG TPA: gliding motility-associated C-terminal domain-containing protein [Bacteroidia bacterium]|nr:gliding motility-associated C-terminal domain-containing protein [Bacteroidia bacterium]